MAIVPVSQLKIGERLKEDVLTGLGNILLYKGKIVHKRELDVLQAFLIKNVNIESDSVQQDVDEQNENQDQLRNSGLLSFLEAYDGLQKLMQRVFKLATGGGNLPILEIRQSVESVINHIDHYHPLTSRPRDFRIETYIINKSILVMLSSYLLAKWSDMPQKDLIPIALAGLLHDIGNVKVDESILFKKEKLKPDELEIMRKHTINGYNILKAVPAINEGVKLCALQHHERFDGSGYPLGVTGDKIHIYAKIVAIADVFNAMTRDRNYKRAESPYVVLEELHKESFGKLDPLIVRTFINKLTQFNNGTFVKLSDGRKGEIVFSDAAHPTRPWVNVNGQIVNLSIERSVYIESVIKI